MNLCPVFWDTLSNFQEGISKTRRKWDWIFACYFVGRKTCCVIVKKDGTLSKMNPQLGEQILGSVEGIWSIKWVWIFVLKTAVYIRILHKVHPKCRHDLLNHTVWAECALCLMIQLLWIIMFWKARHVVMNVTSISEANCVILSELPNQQLRVC